MRCGKATESGPFHGPQKWTKGDRAIQIKTEAKLQTFVFAKISKNQEKGSNSIGDASKTETGGALLQSKKGSLIVIANASSQINQDKNNQDKNNWAETI